LHDGNSERPAAATEVKLSLLRLRLRRKTIHSELLMASEFLAFLSAPRAVEQRETD
jgi:hypothetical protein